MFCYNGCCNLFIRCDIFEMELDWMRGAGGVGRGGARLRYWIYAMVVIHIAVVCLFQWEISISYGLYAIYMYMYRNTHA